MKKAILSVLLLSAVCASPASANYFSNPQVGVNLNVGSAPNPTPMQLRLLGDELVVDMDLDAEPRSAENDHDEHEGERPEHLGVIHGTLLWVDLVNWVDLDRFG